MRWYLMASNGRFHQEKVDRFFRPYEPNRADIPVPKFFRARRSASEKCLEVLSLPLHPGIDLLHQQVETMNNITRTSYQLEFCTFVLASFALKTGWANALKIINKVSTSSAVLARIRDAVVYQNSIIQCHNWTCYRFSIYLTFFCFHD